MINHDDKEVIKALRWMFVATGAGIVGLLALSVWEFNRSGNPFFIFIAVLSVMAFLSLVISYLRASHFILNKAVKTSVDD